MWSVRQFVSEPASCQRGTVSHRCSAEHKAQSVIFNTAYLGFWLWLLPATATSPTSCAADDSWALREPPPHGTGWKATSTAWAMGHGRLENRACVGQSSTSSFCAENTNHYFLKLFTQLKRPHCWQWLDRDGPQEIKQIDRKGLKKPNKSKQKNKRTNSIINTDFSLSPLHTPHHHHQPPPSKAASCSSLHICASFANGNPVSPDCCQHGVLAAQTSSLLEVSKNTWMMVSAECIPVLVKCH